MRFLSEAEGEGFEPSSDPKARNGFRDRRIRPLCHPSRPTPAAGSEAEKEGFEPSKEVAPLNALAGRCLQPLGHFSGRFSPAQGIPSPNGESPVRRMTRVPRRAKIVVPVIPLTLP